MAGHEPESKWRGVTPVSGDGEGLPVLERDAMSGPIDIVFPAPIPARVRFAKRCLDIIGSITGLVLFSPIMLATAIAVKLSSPGPVLFRQERIGGTTAEGMEMPFQMLKFRTMVANAEAESGPVWAEEGDARVTRIGRFLRRSRLDEMPQFWNVLMGSMSLVGPRPERAFFTRELSGNIPAYEDRVARTKPGITGLAQISLDYDSSVESVRSKVFYDVGYNAHLYGLISYFKIEFKILFLTVFVVITGKGAR